jgi:hypothetical protein
VIPEAQRRPLPMSGSHTRAGVVGHCAPSVHFRVQQVDLSGFDHLCRCLDRLTRRPFAFVIRGEPLPDTDLNKTRRLAHTDPKTGEAAAFTEAARSWFAVDIVKPVTSVTPLGILRRPQKLARTFSDLSPCTLARLARRFDVGRPGQEHNQELCFRAPPSEFSDSITRGRAPT